MKLNRFLNRGTGSMIFASAAFCPDEQPVKIHNTVRIAKSILDVFFMAVAVLFIGIYLNYNK